MRVIVQRRSASSIWLSASDVLVIFPGLRIELGSTEFSSWEKSSNEIHWRLVFWCGLRRLVLSDRSLACEAGQCCPKPENGHETGLVGEVC